MIEPCSRGGERTNVSRMHSDLVDLTPAIQQRVNDTLRYGFRFMADKIDVLYHDNEVCITEGSVVYSIPFYPLDKDLTQKEIEDINLHFLGYELFENTVLQPYVTIMTNAILRAVTREFDLGAERVILHFAPADTIEYAGTVALPLYGFIANNTLQMETAFFVEGIKESTTYFYPTETL